MKGWIAKDASGLLEILNKGMKIAQSFQVCRFPDFIVWQSVFAKRTPSISNVGCLYFSFYEQWAFGLPASYLCRLLSSHCLHVLPCFCPIFLHIPQVLTLAEIPAFITFISSLASHVVFSFSFACSPASEALMDICSGKCRISFQPHGCSRRQNQEAVHGPQSSGGTSPRLRLSVQT